MSVLLAWVSNPYRKILIVEIFLNIFCDDTVSNPYRKILIRARRRRPKIAFDVSNPYRKILIIGA